MSVIRSFLTVGAATTLVLAMSVGTDAAAGTTPPPTVPAAPGEADLVIWTDETRAR